jgi:nitrite reductase (NO-forming)
MSRRNWYLLTNAVVLVWLLLAIIAVAVHRFVPQPLWLMVHLPLLGAATAAILIWSQHFADVLLRRPAPLGRPGLAVRLGLHTTGASLVCVGIVGSLPTVAVVGASVVSSAIVLHFGSLVIQSRRALPARLAVLIQYYSAAAFVFLGGIAVGAIMAVSGNSDLVDRLVVAHLILNAFGWIGLTALGTLVLLWPTVLRTRLADSATTTARRALPVLVSGLVIAALGAVFDMRPLTLIGMLGWVAGALLVGVDAGRHSRVAPPASFASWSLALAYGWALVAGGALAVGAAIAPTWSDYRSGYLVMLGPLVAGFALQLLLGALSHLLPVVAMGSPAAARAAAAVLDRGAAARVAALNGALALYLLPMPSVARVLLSLVAAATVVGFLVLAVAAVVTGRRVRRAEGDAAADVARVDLGLPGTRPPLTGRPQTAGLVAAIAVLSMCVAGGVAADPAAIGLSVAAPSGPVIASGETTRVTVEVEGMRYTPSVIEVPYGDALIVTFHNTGTDVHDLTFANGVRTQRLMPDDTETIEVGLVGTSFAGWCSIAGHRQMGMELMVIATGVPEGVDVADDTTETTGAGNTAPVAVDLSATPSAGFEPWPAALTPAPDTTVHRITLPVEEIVAEVAPGVRQTRWTFGGTAPGPVLRGHVGDTFEITLVNTGSIGHSIDFHAGALAPNGPMRTILPGETLTYRFTANQAGIWMYHCSTMPMSMHIANGMFGAVIIDPPDLPAVDTEYVLIQSDLYLGAQEGLPDAERIATQNPDLIAFNGYANQYAYTPLTATVGERVRVWVLDAGPNRPSSFHVVGGQFDTVYLEGSLRLTPDAPGGSQALGLQPAQGGFVELTFPESGDYPFVTHIMSDAEKGARGIFHVE